MKELVSCRICGEKVKLSRESENHCRICYRIFGISSIVESCVKCGNYYCGNLPIELPVIKFLKIDASSYINLCPNCIKKILNVGNGDLKNLIKNAILTNKITIKKLIEEKVISEDFIEYSLDRLKFKFMMTNFETN